MAKYKRITYEERKQIEKMCKEGVPLKYISQLLEIAPSTLNHELKRCPGEYSADEAQKTLGG